MSRLVTVKKMLKLNLADDEHAFVNDNEINSILAQEADMKIAASRVCETIIGRAIQRSETLPKLLSSEPLQYAQGVQYIRDALK